MDWVKSVFARLKASGAVNKDIIKLEQKFIRLAETAKKQRVKDEAKQGVRRFARTALLIHRRLFIKQRIAFCICNMVDSLPILY